MTTRRTPANATARRVQVRLFGERRTRELWVKPYTAHVGARIQYRELGPDWPWHTGTLLERTDREYVIAV